MAADTEKGDVSSYAVGLFNYILGNPADTHIALDRAHRVGPPRAKGNTPADILVCVQDFRTKEAILKRAREMQPLTYLAQPAALYQDLAAITLRKRQMFRPITAHLRERSIRYTWGHPFRLIFQLGDKLYQLRSLKEAADLLGVTLPDPDSDTENSTAAAAGPSPSGWQSQRRHNNKRPNATEAAQARRSVVEALTASQTHTQPT